MSLSFIIQSFTTQVLGSGNLAVANVSQLLKKQQEDKGEVLCSEGKSCITSSKGKDSSQDGRMFSQMLSAKGLFRVYL